MFCYQWWWNKVSYIRVPYGFPAYTRAYSKPLFHIALARCRLPETTITFCQKMTWTQWLSACQTDWQHYSDSKRDRRDTAYMAFAADRLLPSVMRQYNTPTETLLQTYPFSRRRLKAVGSTSRQLIVKRTFLLVPKLQQCRTLLKIFIHQTKFQ